MNGTKMLVSLLLVVATNLARIHGFAANIFQRSHYIFDSEPAITFLSCYGNVSGVNHLISEGHNVNKRDWLYQTPLHLAAKFNRLEVVRVLVENGANVNSRNRDYHETPLHLAAKSNNIEMMKFLIEHGAEVDAQVPKNIAPGGTPMIYAVMYANSVDAVDFLVSKGANVNVTNSFPQNALHLAIDHQNIYLSYQLVVKHKINKEVKDEWGNTPLNWLVKLFKEPQMALARLLVVGGANKETKDNDGRTPLHNAARFGHVEIVLLLLRNNAEVNTRDNLEQTPLASVMSHGVGRTGKVARLLLIHGANPNAGDSRGCNCPLHLLLFNSKRRRISEIVGLVEQLLIFGADIYTVDSCSGYSALQIAANTLGWRMSEMLRKLVANSDYLENANMTSSVDHLEIRHAIPDLIMGSAIGHLPAVKYAVTKLHVNVNLRDYRNQTALHLAAHNGHYNVAIFLLKYGADARALDESGRTPLHYAAAGGHVKMMDLLLNNGAQADSVASNGASPIHYAIDFRNSSDILDILDRHGANLSQPLIPDFMEPIHFAVVNQNFQFMELLLERGVNINARNRLGATPLNHLLKSDCCYPQLPIVGFLVDHGADIEAANRDGFTPLHMAIMAKKEYQVVEYLLYRGANPNAHDAKGCNTPLILLSKEAEPGEDASDMAALLIQFGADYSRVDDCSRKTALDFATENKQLELEGLLKSLP